MFKFSRIISHIIMLVYTLVTQIDCVIYIIFVCMNLWGFLNSDYHDWPYFHEIVFIFVLVL